MASSLPTPKATTISHNFLKSKAVPSSKHLKLEGDAHYVTDSKEGVVLLLTKTDAAGTPLQSSWGRAIHATSVLFSQPGTKAKFDTTIKFILKPKTSNDIPADGLAFFIVPEDHTFPDSTGGGNLGIYDPSGESPGVFAVEFDIYVNKDWDPDHGHLGINIESRTSKYVTKFPHSFIGKEVSLSISYNPTTGAIIATAAAEGSKSVEVSDVLDLSTILPEKVKVGLGASTGSYVAIHDVLTWDFSSSLVDDDEDSD